MHVLPVENKLQMQTIYYDMGEKQEQTKNIYMTPKAGLRGRARYRV